MRLSPTHLRRYKDIALLLLKYGRSDLARHIQQSNDDFEPEAGVAGRESTDAPAADPRPDQLADDLERLGPPS